ncbi:MAG: response regulator transcription factor [Chloroflexi bacterium]|nr:response regulator transcription factor [Chloroflexota bacterium]
MSTRALIVEDEQSIQVLLQEILERAEYEVRVSANGRDGLREFFTYRPEVVLLDIGMPQMDGWTLLERIREVSQTPVLFITALATESNKVRGLNAGADDYIVKPFGGREVIARIEAVLRRATKPEAQDTLYQDPALTVDREQHRVFLHGREMELTPTEFKLVSVLTRNAGNVLTQDRLLDLVWGLDGGGSESVRLYISYLRKKLADEGEPDLIQTVRGVGYRYSPPQPASRAM